QKITPVQKYWFDLVEEAYDVGERSYREVASRQLPARMQEQALVDFFAQRSDEISKRIGRKINLASQKPYTGTHNSGYTECQEFFGAITLDSYEPLGNRIVTMLDVALRGIGDRWNDVVMPGFDFCVVEITLGKYGTRVENLTKGADQRAGVGRFLTSKGRHQPQFRFFGAHKPGGRSPGT